MPDGTALGRTGFRTDHYELTMLAAARRSGAAPRPVVFEVFTRALPPGRRFGVVAGTGRLADAVAAFGFGEPELAYLERLGTVDSATLDWLARYRFDGSIVGYAEGEVFFPGSPVLRVEGTFATTVLLETIVLSILNHDAAVAAAAARMAIATGGNARLVDMGGRRTHEEAAIDAARAAFIGGFHATSNLEAGRRYGIPTIGTAAHAFILVHANEQDAFVAQLDALGPDTTLLVDTYDTETGIRAAVAAARQLGRNGPGAIRIDSGDLTNDTRRARALLDELGARATRIVASGDLDEFQIAALERDARGRAPIDSYGVGTRLVTGAGHPSAGFVYKLVEVDGRPVAKQSAGKSTVGGAKTAFRLLDAHGSARSELVVGDGSVPARARPLPIPIIEHGDPASMPTLGAARAHHLDARAELPAAALELEPGPPGLPTDVVHA